MEKDKIFTKARLNDTKTEVIVRYYSKNESEIRLIGEKTFPLNEVSAKGIKEFRKGSNPGLVLKKNGKLFLVPIPTSFKAPNICNHHMCCYGNTICKRLSALPVEEGGCEKVINTRCDSIEDYPFITDGGELINIENSNGIWVENCTNFEPEE